MLVRAGPGGGTPGRGRREGRQVNSVRLLLAGLGGRGHRGKGAAYLEAGGAGHVALRAAWRAEVRG